MKLVFDCERMKYPYTGLYEYCAQLGMALQTTAKADSELIYYVPKSCIGYFGTQYKYIEQKSIQKHFPRRVKNIDIWHTTYQSSSYMKGNKQVKRTLTLHDLNFLHEKASQAKIKKHLEKIQNNISRADSIVAISEYAKTDMLRHLDIQGKPVTVIYNGNNVLEFPGYDNPVYKPMAPFLFSLGTVLPKKNFHTLPCLLVSNDYELVIAGHGHEDYIQKIMDEARKHGVTDRVKLIGAVSAEDKYWYLKNCTAFLFPSLAEGFGIPPIEAMHFGKPVFLSTITSLPEIGGSFAYYFENFEPEYMQHLFEQSMAHYLLTNPAKAIIQHANQFNWIESAKAYWNVYRSIL